MALLRGFAASVSTTSGISPPARRNLRGRITSGGAAGSGKVPGPQSDRQP